MKKIPELVVMLTHNDRTVPDAAQVFEACKDSRACFWGMKEEGISKEEMIRLYARMKELGKTTFLEVVAYTEKECLEGAALAVECGSDYLMGTIYSDSVNDFCKAHDLKYLPFVGKITGRPSVLDGSIDGMIHEAEEYLKKGVYGFDLLGYRYVKDAVLLKERFVREVHAPVCLAGSINSFARLDEVKKSAPWTFTIGSAFFEHAFGDSISEQIDLVCEYMNKR